MAHKMNGGKPHGGRAYDSNFSAFQKKGLISPMQKNGEDETLTEHPHKGGVLVKHSGGGKTVHMFKKDGEVTTLDSKEYAKQLKSAQTTQEMKTAARDQG